MNLQLCLTQIERKVLQRQIEQSKMNQILILTFDEMSFVAKWFHSSSIIRLCEIKIGNAQLDLQSKSPNFN